MPDDALERLRRRKRPTVSPRDASLGNTRTRSRSADTQTSRNLDSKSSESTEQALVKDRAASSSQRKTRRSKQADPPSPAVAEPPPVSSRSLGTKQTTIRLEVSLSNRLQDLCRNAGVFREALIEAMFERCEDDPDLMKEILASAQARTEQRQQLANLKRAQSMMQRFGQVE